MADYCRRNIAGENSRFNGWKRATTRFRNPVRGVPQWEKNFCREVGSVPWKKILDPKNYMRNFHNVVRWDDSACEEAFKEAKLRYWSKINGQSCKIPLPNPDMYIDIIDWDPEVDPTISKDDETSRDKEIQEENEFVVKDKFDMERILKAKGWDDEDCSELFEIKFK